MNKWEELLGIRYPECKMTGKCCRMASPSTPAIKLLARAAKGDSYARDFFSIFQPYHSADEVRAKAPQLVERSLTQAAISDKFDGPEQVVFFHCMFISDDNKCLIYEDRPQLCRDYPDTPLLITPPGCAFEGWSKECRSKYIAMKNELNLLKETLELLKSTHTDSIIEYSQKYLRKVISPIITWLK